MCIGRLVVYSGGMCELSYSAYDNISVCSLATLVLCGVVGLALSLGIAASGGLLHHQQASIVVDIVQFYRTPPCLQEEDTFDPLDSDRQEKPNIDW